MNYRQTFNNNLVLIVMIETIEGVKNAARIAKVPGIHGVFAASGDLGNFSGWQEGDAEYEKLITAIHDATLKRATSVRSVPVDRPPGFHLLPD